jgi:hypothetical protein
MAKEKVIICLDWNKDLHYKFLFEAWYANPDFNFLFNDEIPSVINISNVDRIKADLTYKIRMTTYTLIIVGANANMYHKDYKLIGYRNWQNFEIARSRDNNNKMVVARIDRNYDLPDELSGCGVSWAMAFRRDHIIAALKNA